MIVVATEDFELYHDLIDELTRRQLAFTTISVGAALPPDAAVVIAGETDPLDTPGEVSVIRGDPEEVPELVDAAVEALTDASGRTIVGVDPGDRPGIAVVRGDRIVAAYQVPLASATECIEAAVGDDPDAIVRIGDGARLSGAQLIDTLDDITVELVDETGTTPHLGAGARGAGDVLAAVNIASRPGEPIHHRDIEPTEGELTRIQHASRERSPTNREISVELAERVAHGELTIDQALEHHRSSGSNASE